MNARRFAAPLLSAALLLSTAGLAQAQQYGPPPPPQGYGQGNGWDAPPSGFSDIGRRGFHDGMEQARMDWEAHRDMDPYHKPIFRRPPVPPPARQEYRDAFLRGYDVAMHHSRGWDDHDHDNGWHGDRPH